MATFSSKVSSGESVRVVTGMEDAASFDGSLKWSGFVSTSASKVLPGHLVGMVNDRRDEISVDGWRATAHNGELI